MDRRLPRQVTVPEKQTVFAGEFALGGMVRPRLALLVGGDFHARVARDVTYDAGLLRASLRRWVTPHVWIEGGLGPAMTGVKIDDRCDHEPTRAEKWGYGVVGASGVDFITNTDRDMRGNVQVRLVRTAYGSLRVRDVAVLVGFTGAWAN